MTNPIRPSFVPAVPTRQRSQVVRIFAPVGGRVWRAGLGRLGMILALAAAVTSGAAHGAPEPSGARAVPTTGEIAGWLVEENVRLAPGLADRAFWARWPAEAEGRRELAEAGARALATPIPEIRDEDYLAFAREGRREPFEKPYGARRDLLTDLVLAELLEGEGRHLEAVRALVRAILAERTWVMSAHDYEGTAFSGRAHPIDLGVAMRSWQLAAVVQLLGEEALGPALAEEVRAMLAVRAWEPYLAECDAARPQPGPWWARETNNWNAVCHAGVVASGLMLDHDRARRAELVAAALRFLPNYLAGFTDDGYCSEGLGYWSYGFSHYFWLAELLHRASAGRIDLLRDAKTERIARFPARFEIVGGTYPAFADSDLKVRPNWSLVAQIQARYGGLPTRLYAPVKPWRGRDLYSVALAASRLENLPAGDPSSFVARDFFPLAGVLVARHPNPEALHLALKGGHNAEHHNHNDVGTYVVTVGAVPVALDPGLEIYRKSTFGPNRYESPVLNSFGHPVPVVDGRLQETGRAAAARILRHEFGETIDSISFDLSAAYAVPHLRRLEREFRYDRTDAGTVAVTDLAEFSRPARFETAVLTFGAIARTADGLRLEREGRALEVAIDTGGAAWELDLVTLEAELPAGRIPQRAGIRLTEPTVQARVTLLFHPAPAATEATRPDPAGGAR